MFGLPDQQGGIRDNAHIQQSGHIGAARVQTWTMSLNFPRFLGVLGVSAVK